MKIKILSFEKVKNPSTSLFGHASVDVEEKMKMWFAIIRTEKGEYHAMIPNIRVKNEWVPAFSLRHKSTEIKLCRDVVDEMKLERLIR